MAISPDGLRVAFDGSYIPSVTTGSSGSRENGTGMHYLDVETGRLSSVPIESTHAEDEMSWSPSGEAFTYANGNRIYILDVSTGAPKLIGHGQNPTWSPDGQWITFRSMDDWAMAVNPVTLESKKLLPDNKILGAVHWSPDSQYVLVSEAVGALSNILHWRSPIWGPVAELVVYRLRDGARASVNLIPPESFTDLGFQWATDLGAFMKNASKPPIQTCLTAIP